MARAGSAFGGAQAEITGLLMHANGAYLMLGNLTVGVVIGAMVPLLFYLKTSFTEQVARRVKKICRRLCLCRCFASTL